MLNECSKETMYKLYLSKARDPLVILRALARPIDLFELSILSFSLFSFSL